MKKIKNLIESIKFTRMYYTNVPPTDMYKESRFTNCEVDIAFLSHEVQKWRNMALSLLSEKYGDRR